ncbi:J domain-containing protein [Variovorax sp.]|uniref:J domain-containing protein n=1 Tax=Variovorax sp. TaxID=1871043 RepID=UPI003BADBACD
MTISAYPLTWPAHRPRTPGYRIERSGFDRQRSFAVVRDELVREIDRLGGRSLIISTNIPLRQDGLPYATFSRIRDFGVAVYFKYRGQDMCFVCDRWTRIEDNMHAIVKTIDALRGVARWGSGDMMAAAFTGFAALPAPAVPDWQAVLELRELILPTRDDIERAYRRLASLHHPDRGGSADRMAQINRAREQALQETQ